MRGKVGDAFLVANRVRDHPRLCGEKHMVPKRSTPIWGSPPPMRGKAQSRPVICTLFRITPAYAGKSRKPVHRRKPVQDHPRLCGGKSLEGADEQEGKKDHPRLCGEKHSIYSLFKPYLGSPPPMRGKANRRERKLTLLEDHPRLCGEKLW